MAGRGRSRPDRRPGSRLVAVSILVAVLLTLASPQWSICRYLPFASARVADRARVVSARKERSKAADRKNSRVQGRGASNSMAIEGNRYRGQRRDAAVSAAERRRMSENAKERRRDEQQQQQQHLRGETERDRREHKSGGLRQGASTASSSDRTGDPTLLSRPSDMSGGTFGTLHGENMVDFSRSDDRSAQDRFGFSESLSTEEEFGRRLSTQLTGCCTNWQNYQASKMCSIYGADCSEGQQPSHDSGDGSCYEAGLSFIGISFSVNTPQGNPYSYQLCDQFPTENLIDRDYKYIMSMDEDGWLVGGGYKSFDYSGKMPYIDSSHTELLRIGSIDPSYGGTSIEQVYYALKALSFPPFSVFPEYVKGGGGHHSGDDDGDDAVPSGDITLIVSIVEEYEYDNNYSDYELFLVDLFDAMDAVGGGPCMDDHDTDPHMSMARGVKFKSSYHEQQYLYTVNLEVAVWQAMYPNGAVIGSSALANFPPNEAHHNRQRVGYGNLYFFFDRANITKSFPPNRDLSSNEAYYAKLYNNGGGETFYQSVTTVDFDYSGSGSGDNDQYYEHNPYAWNAKMAKHDMTDGWDLPPNCEMEGETFFGIPLSRRSSSKLMSTATFQDQFDFEALLDRNFTYMQKFGTNHGWLIGEEINNGAGSIVDKDTAHIPLFYMGTTNPEMGGMALSDMVKIGKEINFGTLYIKPAFVFQDDDASIKLQFEADADSALGYLYDNLCKMIGIEWNYNKPSNDFGVYTNCAMHAAGDRAKYGCGPDNANSGGFCPQMTIAYRVGFQSEDHAAAYFNMANNYVDYWRAKYPSGVAVGTSKFCQEGGCLGLFLNRYDLYNVYKPDLGGSWVEYNGGTFAPTISPAPTHEGGCDDPQNKMLDKCFRKAHKRRVAAAAWDSLGSVGQFSILLLVFMASTLAISVFLARARKRKKRGESYASFLVRDMKHRRKKKLKKKKKSKLTEIMVTDDSFGSGTYEPPTPRRSGNKSKKSSGKTVKAKNGSKRSSTRSSSKNDSRAVTPVEDKSKRSSSQSRSRSKSKSSSSRSRSNSRGRSRSRSRSRTSAATDVASGAGAIPVAPVLGSKNVSKSDRRQLV